MNNTSIDTIIIIIILYVTLNILLLIM